MNFRLRDTAQKFRGWSLYRLAQEMGIETKAVYSWANGSVIPSVPTLLRLCEAIGCTPNDLIWKNEEIC